MDRKDTSVKQVLRIVLSRKGVPKTIVPDNAPEFCYKNLYKWLKRIECFSYKSPSHHLQSNGITERIVQTVKMGLKAFSPFNESIEAYLP